jgi:hypothetical protein
MRSLLVVCRLIVLCDPDNAFATEHRAKSRDVVGRNGHAVTPSQITPDGLRIYRDDSVPGGLRTDHDPLPSYDDPSRRGSG